MLGTFEVLVLRWLRFIAYLLIFKADFSDGEDRHAVFTYRILRDETYSILPISDRDYDQHEQANQEAHNAPPR
jgi:hypothetical protein